MDKWGKWGYSYLIELKTFWDKEQFLLFPQHFQNLSVDDSKMSIYGVKGFKRTKF